MGCAGRRPIRPHLRPRRQPDRAVGAGLKPWGQVMDEALTRLAMPVPDSTVARRARELIADVAAPFLVNHSVRSYAWAVELARHDRLLFDPEILYVSAMLHDIGLV